MVLVSGPEGSGKTTLAAALAATRDKKEVLFIKASVMLGVSGVLSAMADVRCVSSSSVFVCVGKSCGITISRCYSLYSAYNLLIDYVANVPRL